MSRTRALLGHNGPEQSPESVLRALMMCLAYICRKARPPHWGTTSAEEYQRKAGPFMREDSLNVA